MEQREKMPGVLAFAAKMESVYGRFEIAHEQLVRGEIGVTKDNATRGFRAYLVVLEHRHDVNQIFAEFAAAIAAVAPAIAYDASNLHTTLADLVVPLDDPTWPDQSVLSAMVAATQSALMGNFPHQHLYYDRVVANATTVIAKGVPSPSHIALIESIAENLAAAGVAGARGAWGGHVTLNRFLDDRKPDELEELRRTLLAMPRLGIYSKPVSIVVGTGQISPNGMELVPFKIILFP